MTAMDEIEIDGQSFFVPSNKPAPPVREIPKVHECVCLMLRQVPKIPTAEDLAKLTEGASAQDLIRFRTVRDKCHQVIENPDQAFCDDCEASEHPNDPDQVGLHARL
jgi:hypothetical protein